MEFKEVVKRTGCQITEGRGVHVPKPAQLNYIKNWRASGLSRREFCDLHHIQPKTFGRWIQREKDNPTTHTPSEKAYHLADMLRVELHLPNGVKMYFRDGIEQSCLVSLVKEI